MSDPLPLRLVVEPPSRSGGRRVRVRNEVLGVAYDLADVIEFARRAGLIDVDPTDPVVDWRGGGPEVWI
ncbi:hypothetical protein [Streptomyces sp. ICBB 8177]|uniref:hypothetical protein n=1 Tax=Streptomyces sp. ICBB 8177 TaxID=563922 RepID=UPI000D67B3E5|nr:hypothetical protein [Streptomyces sp. ICBB 8177]PWI45039.1 hypothetical protein CK485_07655 [Streptomyces sp. ICBB 8177]